MVSKLYCIYPLAIASMWYMAFYFICTSQNALSTRGFKRVGANACLTNGKIMRENILIYVKIENPLQYSQETRFVSFWVRNCIVVDVDLT